MLVDMGGVRARVVTGGCVSGLIGAADHLSSAAA